MKYRSSLLLASAAAGLTFGTLSPAHARALDPVSDLSVSVAQTPGQHDSWQVSATWGVDEPGLKTRVVIVDHANGEISQGAHYGNTDTRNTSASFTVKGLDTGSTYWVAVWPVVDPESVVLVPFEPQELDTTPPVARYRLDKTSAYLLPDEELDEMAAHVTIKQTALSGATKRQVVAGDGSGAKTWRSGTTFPLVYEAPGLYTPHVLATDEFGNTTDVKLPAVRVRSDDNAPRVTITRPAKPGAVRSWRHIRGTVSDRETGVAGLGAFVMEKRGAVWWAYDFKTRTWMEGFPSPRKTMNQSDARPFMRYDVTARSWKTPVIEGLTAGTLRVEAMAFDYSFNFARARHVLRTIG